MKIINTICLIQKGDEILLGYKKKGFGQGRWNGFGGKIEPNESIEAAAKREVKEESGLDAINIEKFGILEFGFDKKPDLEIEAHVFKCKDFEGELIESEEMASKWFPIREIPFNKMWDDDKYWLPLFLEGKKFKGKFLFDENDKVLEKNITVVDNI